VYQADSPRTGVAMPRAIPEPALASVEISPPPERLATMRRYASRRAVPDPLLPGLPRHAHRTVVSAQDAAVDPDGPALTPGTLVRWKLDLTVHRSLHVNGLAPWRATCFDQHGELMADVETQANGVLSLPVGTAEVALQGLAPVRAVAGWQIDGDLLRLNRYYFAGEGCLVRIQNMLARPGRGLTETGPCCAQALMEANWVRGRDGLRPGWIETEIPCGRGRFAVSCQLPAGLDASALRVTANAGDRPGAVGDETLTPAAVETDGAVTRLTFDTPAGDGSYLTIHIVPLDPRVAVLGVHAYDQTQETRHRPPRTAELGIVRSSVIVGTAAPGVQVGICAAGQNLASEPLTGVARLRPVQIAAAMGVP